MTSSAKKRRAGEVAKLTTWNHYSKPLANLPAKRTHEGLTPDSWKDVGVLHYQGSVKSNEEIDITYWGDRADPDAYDREDKKRRKKLEEAREAARCAKENN